MLHLIPTAREKKCTKVKFSGTVQWNRGHCDVSLITNTISIIYISFHVDWFSCWGCLMLEEYQWYILVLLGNIGDIFRLASYITHNKAWEPFIRTTKTKTMFYEKQWPGDIVAPLLVIVQRVQAVGNYALFHCMCFRPGKKGKSFCEYHQNFSPLWDVFD